MTSGQASVGAGAPQPEPPPRRTLASVARRVREDPGHVYRSTLALLRGWMTVVEARTRGVRLRAGRNFRVYGRLDARGPGEIVFGDDALLFEEIRAWTYAPEATIRFGDRLQMTGARFGCAREITIGDDCFIGASYTLDTNFHSTSARRHDPASPVRVAPVVLGDNVWIAYGAGVLPGTRIGDNAVVSFGTVCRGRYPADAIMVGNPGRVVGSVADGQVGADAARAADRAPFPADRGERSALADHARAAGRHTGGEDAASTLVEAP